MELSGITPPRFDWEDTNLPEQWERFKRHIELIFKGPLKEKSEEEKVAYLLLWIGEKGRDVHATWTGISATDAKNLKHITRSSKTTCSLNLTPFLLGINLTMRFRTRTLPTPL